MPKMYILLKNKTGNGKTGTYKLYDVTTLQYAIEEGSWLKKITKYSKINNFRRYFKCTSWK